MLDSTMVVIGTEFGRTPDIVTEHQMGRDHFPAAYSAVIAGGGVKGGIRYGVSDGKGKKVLENEVSPKMLNATIAYALGLPLEHELFSASGRPFTVADKGRPVTSLFA